MGIIDVRKASGEVDSIVFKDSEDYVGAIIYRHKGGTVEFQDGYGCDVNLDLSTMKRDDVVNLIAALQKAVELNWFN